MSIIQSSLRSDQSSADHYEFMVCVSLIPSHLSPLPLDPGDLSTDLTLSITLHHRYSRFVADLPVNGDLNIFSVN